MTDNKSFVLHLNLKRTTANLTPMMNWHEDLEIQFCSMGEGSVLLDGRNYEFETDGIIIVNSNVIHHTSTDKFLEYSALIISSAFCKQMGIDYDLINFNEKINDKKILALFDKLKVININKNISHRVAKQNSIILQILIHLAENYSTSKNLTANSGKAFNHVKNTIKYIRENYKEKITLDKISKSILADKYVLTREFKKITGHTIIEYTNIYRCGQAAKLISSGKTVSEAAYLCGFENLSFFQKPSISVWAV